MEYQLINLLELMKLRHEAPKSSPDSLSPRRNTFATSPKVYFDCLHHATKGNDWLIVVHKLKEGQWGSLVIQ